MSKRTLLLGMLALVSLHLGGCGKNRELAYAKVQIAELERQIADLESQLAAKEAELAACRAGGGGQVAAPSEGGVANTEWSTRNKEVVISISNEVLFKPGSALLSDKSKHVLDQVIAKVKHEYPNAYVRVEGHTDDQQIKKSKDKWDDNWDLSGGRAQAVLHYLLDHGVAAKDLGFAGYGMERPRASNGSADGKSRNRRVEIVVIPK